MTTEYKLAVTREQGQLLLQVTNMFGLPEKLGDSLTFPIAERRAANKDVQRLYNVLRAKSPLLISKRKVCFGSKEGWEENVEMDQNGRPVFGMRIVAGREHEEFDLQIDPYVLSGIRWCLLISAHPASLILKPASVQVEVVEPLTSRIRATKWLERMTGEDKAERKQVDLDEASDDVGALTEILGKPPVAPG